MKWRSADCPKNGVLEVTGNLFLRLKCCEPRCEDYRDCECDVEKMFNAAALQPVDVASGVDSICCFNEKLFDYGELGDFRGVCKYYDLKRQDNKGKTFYSASASNWLALLTQDRKLMFAVFAHITESIAYQHFQIFGELNDHWNELIKKDPAFYTDFRRIKQFYPKLHLETLEWVDLCLCHRELYGQLLADGECKFSDLLLAELLARYPDLDDRAYEELRQRATGEVWLCLLRGGVDEAHQKFWNDCDYSSFNGAQWLELLDDAVTRQEALARLNGGKYSSCFSDADWDTLRGSARLQSLQRSYWKNIKFRPGIRNFTNFFRFAPRHAAFAQFSGMIGISLTVSMLGMAGMLLWTGASSIPLTAVLMIGEVIWAVVATSCISRVAVRKEWTAVLHGVLVGAAGSAGLLLFSLFFWSWCGARSGVEGVWDHRVGIVGFAIVEALFLVPFLVANVAARVALRERIGMKKADLSWVFYAIFALMIAGTAVFWFAGTDKARYDYCSRSGFPKAGKYFEGRFLANEKYWARWKRACENCDAAELRILTRLWHPKPVKSGQVVRSEGQAAGEQLMDALLKERENDKEGGSHAIGEFVNNQWGIGGDEKQYIRKKFIQELSKGDSATPARIIAFLKVMNDYGLPIDGEIRKNVMSFAARRNDLKEMYAVWEQMDDNGKAELAGRILTQVLDGNFSLVKSDGDVACLTGIAGKCPGVFDTNFWAELLKNQVDRGLQGTGDFHEKACRIIEKLPECDKLVDDSRKDYRNRVTQREIDEFGRIVKGDRRESTSDLLDFLQSSKHLHVEENGYRYDWLFWLGYAKARGNRDDGDWEKCCDAFLNLRKFKFEETRVEARRNRGKLAKMLVDRSEEGRQKALLLWKKCLENGDETYAAYRGILSNEQDPAEFGKYFFEAAGSRDAPKLRSLLKEHARELAKCEISPANVGELLKLYDGRGREIPRELRSRIDSIDVSALSPVDRLEIAKYYLSVEDWKQARKAFGSTSLDKVKACVGDYCEKFNGDYGGICYGLALIDPAIIDEAKRRLDNQGFLSDLRAKFEGVYNGTNRAFVQEAVKYNHPEAIFVTCLAKYFENLRGDSDFDIGKLEQDLGTHHPNSRYVEYLDKLKDAAGR